LDGIDHVTIEFDSDVFGPDHERRQQVLGWLGAALAAVDPERLTAEALRTRRREKTAIIAIGKAAPAMSRGAASALDVVSGICVTDHIDDVPDAVTLLVGDHPVPGKASYAAGAAVLGAVRRTPPDVDLVALISGGGSALCEAPRQGVPFEYLTRVNERLVSAGIGIEELNLVRSHLSSVKGGGLARAAGRPISTLVISDVGPAGPGVVASGPTIQGRHDPDHALAVLKSLSIEVPGEVARAMRQLPPDIPVPETHVLADGRVAARAVMEAAPRPASLARGWIHGPVEIAVGSFIASAGPGVTVGAGEVSVEVTGDGLGGRCTHAALLAARYLGPDDLLCVFASDGVDGRSGASGAIVDGSTIGRGGDPTRALDNFDSARYLAATSDLLSCPPTGTNVSDLWILWRR
jgi:hydroxypyruvate reductase